MSQYAGCESQINLVYGHVVHNKFAVVEKNHNPLQILRLSLPEGGGGVLWISGDGDDRMGAKVETQKTH